jgi:hypothetical protein
MKLAHPTRRRRSRARAWPHTTRCTSRTDNGPATWGEQGTPASVNVRAAECVMTHSAKAIEIEDIEARVSELERMRGWRVMLAPA